MAAKQEIRLTDLAHPVLSEIEQQTIAATPEVVLTEASVLGAATAATGLSDFGADDFRERLGVWLQSINEDSGLGPLGRAMLFEAITRWAGNRLKIEDLVKRHPEILATQLPRPVIVCGLPRSGTTHLVNLLATHPDLRSTQLWETNEPVPNPDEMSYASDDSNPRYRRSNEVWHVMTKVLEHWPAMNEYSPGHVHEEVELHCFDFASYMIEWWARVPRWQRYTEGRDQTQHYAYVKKVNQVMSWLHGPNRWVMKSPQIMECLPEVLAVYPDAQVVITHRDPVAVLQSAITMMAYIDRVRRTEQDLPGLADYWINRIERLLKKCVAERDLLPAGQVRDVMFHDYMADEFGTVETVCREAGLPITADSHDRLGRYLRDNPRGKYGRLVYDPIGDFGIDIAALRRRFAFYYERFPVRVERVTGE